MGIVVVKEEKPASLLRSMMVNTGGVAGPMDCALVLRGIKTLAVRMKQHQENALELARRLEAHPAVEKVFYPGLASHEHHALAQKQMRGFGGVVSVYLKNNSKAAANSVIKNMKAGENGRELGRRGKPREPQLLQSHSGMSAEVKAGLGIREGLLRFSAGIEDIDDIWADIAAALEAVCKTIQIANCHGIGRLKHNLSDGLVISRKNVVCCMLHTRHSRSLHLPTIQPGRHFVTFSHLVM